MRSPSTLVAIATLLVGLVALGCGRPGTSRRAALDRATATRVAANNQRVADGAIAYSKYCALCHGPDGKGYAADNAPSLVSATFLATASDSFLERSIREGRPGTAMAPYAKARGGPLDDDTLSSLVLFLRSFAPGRIPLGKAPVLGDATRGELVFSEACQSCHGSRQARGFAVDLGNTSLLSTASDPFLRYAIVHGRPGTPMPPFRDVLGDGAIDDVVAALRNRASPQRDNPRAGQREPPPIGDVLINPKGKSPDFKLRADRFVSIDDVKAALDAKQRLVILDARAASDWFTLHIPGAVSAPYYLLPRLDSMPQDGTWIVAYCACPHHASGVVVDELRKRGFKHTAVLDEGIFAWQKRGYPTEGSSP